MAADGARSNNEQLRRYLIMNVFYAVIVDRVESTDIMIHLQQLPAVKRIFNELRKLDKVGKHKEAMMNLLELVDKSDEPGKWKLFIDSLKEAEYDHLYNCLEDLKDMPNLEGEKQYKLIGIFTKSIITQVGLEQSGILSMLHGHRVITENQFQKLRNCIRHNCEQDAWLDLFSCIHKRSNNWYYILLEAFIDNGHTELVKNIDPEFLPEKDGKQFNYEKMDYEESVLTGCGGASDLGDCSGFDIQQCRNDFSPSLRLKFDSLETGFLSNKMETASTSYKKVTKTKDFNIPVGEEDVKVSPGTVQTTERDSDCKELILSPDEDKLCENALKGENDTICLPTESAKTFVAAKIIMEHIKTRREICKVVVLVIREASIEQTSRKLEECLIQRFEIITGDTQSTEREILAKLLPVTDIKVMTAQRFVARIVEKEIDDVTFSLIIFDECTHTEASRPYNQFLNRYIDLQQKYESGGAQYVPALPQIVGLTSLSCEKHKAGKAVEENKHVVTEDDSEDEEEQVQMIARTVLKEEVKLAKVLMKRVPGLKEKISSVVGSLFQDDDN